MPKENEKPKQLNLGIAPKDIRDMIADTQCRLSKSNGNPVSIKTATFRLIRDGYKGKCE